MQDRLEEIERRYDEIAGEMSSPGVASDPSRLRELGKAFAEPAPRCAMMTGFFAPASMRAACCTTCAGGAEITGCMILARSSASAGHVSHSTSRGNDRYTGPFGVVDAIAWARSMISNACSGKRNS